MRGGTASGKSSGMKEGENDEVPRSGKKGNE